jgi:hypothetical protein
MARRSDGTPNNPDRETQPSLFSPQEMAGLRRTKTSPPQENKLTARKLRRRDVEVHGAQSDGHVQDSLPGL